jgi:hypothetical protein
MRLRHSEDEGYFRHTAALATVFDPVPVATILAALADRSDAP